MEIRCAIGQWTCCPTCPSACHSFPMSPLPNVTLLPSHPLPLHPRSQYLPPPSQHRPPMAKTPCSQYPPAVNPSPPPRPRKISHSLLPFSFLSLSFPVLFLSSSATRFNSPANALSTTSYVFPDWNKTVMKHTNEPVRCWRVRMVLDKCV